MCREKRTRFEPGFNTYLFIIGYHLIVPCHNFYVLKSLNSFYQLNVTQNIRNT